MRPITWIRGEHWTVCTVQTDNGERPVQHYLDNLDAGYDASKRGLLHLFDRIGASAQGPRCLPAAICHQIDGPIWQLTKGDLRLLWFYDPKASRVIVCGHCFLKKGQKTPRSELATALRIHRAITGENS